MEKPLTILIATGNRHKLEEIAAILGPSLRFLGLHHLKNPPAPVEDAPDFAGNATKKAVTLANWLAETGVSEVDYVLADDSGLEVDALGGAPGVHSARFAALDTGTAGNSPDPANNAKLLRLLTEVPPEKRTGRFRCVLALCPVPEPVNASSPACSASEAELGTELFDGACPGRILDRPRGEHGFGYDPLFVPDGFTESFAQLGAETKNRISHRSQALHKLAPRLKQIRATRAEG